ncbi:MAG TPA: FtsX-like permease family protein, partial [Segetibacter sp.]|nr:FtsX-like permease family protein [Segetibacter sp.]
GRAKEVGVRKVMGSARIHLICQFLTESLMLSIFSAVLAFALAKIFFPYFNQLAGTKLNFSVSQYPELGWLLISLTLLTGVLAGSYPALILSGFKPVEVLKSKIRLGGSNLFTRSLVTVQFVLSIGLIVSTVIILQQLKFMRSKNLGFKKENVVVIDATGTEAAKIYPLFRQSLQSHNGIIGITGSEIGMGEGNGHMGAGFDYKGETKGVIMYPVDADYLKVMGMQLIAGRDFNSALASDSTSSIIVNQALLKDFNLTLDNAIGQQLMQKRFEGGNEPKTIIGVVKDFNFSALKENIRPQMFLLPSTLNARKFFVRIDAGDPSKQLAAINMVWKSIVPDLPFKYSFLDEDFDRFYKSEERLGNIVGSAGTISIFLACLGLFGLTALAAVNRTKEIGIRKVLGAPVSAIVGLLSKDFLKLVVIAIVIATPVAWYFMNKWLQDYVYRVNISWAVFAIAGLLSTLIALVTISFQAIKAASANPVKSLRTE